LLEARPARPSTGTLLLAALGGSVALAYPAAAEWALAAWGPRDVALALLAAGLLSVLLLRRHRGLPGLGRFARILLLAFPVLAAVTGSALPLRLVPAAIQGALAAIFLLSLRGGRSILREAARRMHPYAPDFIGPYCRRATAAFAALFALQAGVLALHAIRPPVHGWAQQASTLVWGPIAVATAVEWMLRKALFRYYGDGPVDRLLGALMPPEKTARGRRSLEYIRGMRRELGLPPP
jgi:uncharacterized membrane protein